MIHVEKGKKLTIFFLNECADEISNRSDDLQIDLNVEDDLMLILPLLLRKKKLIQRVKGKQSKVTLTSIQPQICKKATKIKMYQMSNTTFRTLREPSFYLDAPLLRGKYVTPI